MTNKKYDEMSFIEFQERFNNEEKCRNYFFKLRWPDGHICEECRSDKCKKITTRNKYFCSNCGRQFSLIKGTVLEGTHLPVKKWFCAIYLMAKDKRGISNLQLSRELNISYRAAALITRNIKNAMSQRDMKYMLEGIINMDEAFIGKPSGKAGRGTDKSKVIVALSVDNNNHPLYLKLKLVDN